MAKTKYIVRFDGQIVGNRTTDRVYTHAIVCMGHGKNAHVATWCGRPDLALKEQRKYQDAGYRAEIVPVEEAVKPGAMSWQDKAIAATRGTQLGAIIACVLDREIDGPRFRGKASVTSDGFVMCDFIDKNGEGRMGAMVGSLSDLSRNVVGLAKHLNLNAQERAEYSAKMKGWISLDYSGNAAKSLEVA